MEDMADHVAEKGFDLPYNLGSRGSCCLGGNVATNAGGSKQLKHGSLRSKIVGLEAVLADGTIINDMSTIRKDNSGYDVKQLMIGSEGTLGVITEAALMCPSQDPPKRVLMVAVATFEKCVQILKHARRCLGSSLSAFEMLDRTCLQ
mmetsp:Transcript_21795/g.26881  ORF Transcript_21795/g.26881 Transcript_21795/m.26881 type:complete len:147 (-) Transcript_21795:683-1123(-)|eukprot:CAMPEP_0170461988 /NCGR_PEP_ID=MMETSP0123-20130129/7672_1 /TAXON_ID=182087 /ORGANISM="Favella ehrenbergii, Strain Fehren 1" /LENGTH=146 /DNA_ID=CAMNT_0010727115 /DNA_START=459 /DNA_END=899 /DNA_ORIENTATION=+